MKVSLLEQRLKTLQPETDYQALMAQMTELSHPRRKLKDLQNAGTLIRVKKGFYVLTPEFLGRSYSPEIVANLLYGPSYVSLESALSVYGLIPERVEVRTSVTTLKNKSFTTPIGNFSYAHLHLSLYPLGVTFGDAGDGRKYLMASPEKAVLDVLTLKFRGGDQPPRKDEVRTMLEDDLRINFPELRKMSRPANTVNWELLYRNRPWCRLFLEILRETT